MHAFVGSDISSAALALAVRNAARLGIGNVTFVASDWFAALPHERFDLIAGNPPYVAADDPHLARRRPAARAGAGADTRR